MLGWLRRQFARLPRQRPDLTVVMYHRKGCHLCDVAWEQLVAAQTRYGFALEQKDVDADPAALKEYGECVPVVTVNGGVRFRGRVNDVLLRRLLDAAPSVRGREGEAPAEPSAATKSARQEPFPPDPMAPR